MVRSVLKRERTLRVSQSTQESVNLVPPVSRGGGVASVHHDMERVR